MMTFQLVQTITAIVRKTDLINNQNYSPVFIMNQIQLKIIMVIKMSLVLLNQHLQCSLRKVLGIKTINQKIIKYFQINFNKTKKSIGTI